MYLLSRIFPGSELDPLAGPEGRLRKVGLFAGSHEPGRLSSPDLFLKPSGLEESENLGPDPLGVELLESELLESELLESEPLEADLLGPELLKSELLESEPLESELLESEPLEADLLGPELLKSELLESELLESEPLEVRRTAASRLEAEAPLERSVVLPDDRVADPLEADPLESEPSESVLLAADPLGLELLEAELRGVVPLEGRRAGESLFELSLSEYRLEPAFEVPDGAFRAGPFLLEYVPDFFSAGFLPFSESELLILRFRQRY